MAYIPLPAARVPKNAMADFSPINNALDTSLQQQQVRQNAMAQNKQLSMQQERMGMQRQAFDAQKGEAALNRYAGIAQMISQAPPEQQSAMWERAAPLYHNLRKSIPEFDQDAQMFGVDPNDPKAVGEFIVARQRGLQDPMARRETEAGIGLKEAQAQYYRGKDAAKADISPAQKAVDTAFGKDYAAFASGGFADLEKNISQLEGVIVDLESGEQNLTGPVLGMLPDRLTSFTNPQSVATREAVEEVVQRNLRLILGAQFTEREGERLISRSYNPRLSEAENAKRLRRLSTAMRRAYQSKIEAARYYEANGTLKGLSQMTVADIEREMEAEPKPQDRLSDAPQPGSAAPQPAPGGTNGFKYIGPAP